MRAGLRDQRQLGRELEVRLQVHDRAAQGDGGQPAQPPPALPALGEGQHAAPRLRHRRGRRVEDHQPSRTVHHGRAARPQVSRETRGAQHGRDAERAQHHRCVAVGPALLRGHARHPRRVDQGRVRGGQPLGGQDGAGRQAGERAERRPGEVADQPAGDLVHLVGSAPPRGQVVGIGGRQRGGDRVRLVRHRLFRGAQCLADPRARAAQQAGRPEHLHVGVQQRRDLRLRVLRQHMQPGAQLAQLLAGRGDGALQAGALCLDIGGGDAMPGDGGGRLDRAEHRPDGDAGADGQSAQPPLGGKGGSEGGLNPVHGSRLPPAPRGRRAPRWRRRRSHASPARRPCSRPASSGP